MWSFEHSQIAVAMQRTVTLWQAQELDRLQLWWLGPGGSLPGMSGLFCALLALWMASAVGLAGMIRAASRQKNSLRRHW